MLLISRCGEAYEIGTQPVRAAAQAAASQTLMAFCTFLGSYRFGLTLAASQCLNCRRRMPGNPAAAAQAQELWKQR